MSIRVDITEKGIDKAIRNLRKNGVVDRTVRKVTIRTVNTTARKASSYASKKIIRKHINLRARDVKKAIKVQLSPNSATWNSPVASIIFRHRLVPVQAIPGGRQTRKGYSVKILKKGGRKTIKSAFRARMPNPKNKANRHVGVFQRLTRKRLPIKELYTTTPWNVMDFAGSMSQLENYIAVTLPLVFANKAARYKKEIGPVLSTGGGG